MKRVCALTAAGASAIALAACSSGEGRTPSAPSPAPAAIRAMSLSSTSISPSTIQLSARASLSDGSSRDVTLLSRWDSSNPGLGLVSASGVVTVLGSGPVEIRATYEDVTGAIGLILNGPVMPGSFALSGIAVEAAPGSGTIGGVRLTVTEGPDAGLAETTDRDGTFTFSSLKPGLTTLEAAKDGYLPWRVTRLALDRDRQIDVVLYPTPPKDASGAVATARCRDASWSWSASRADACATRGGIAYGVCPGPFCELALIQ